MADIKLGLYGAEVTLPQVNANLGAPPALPWTYRKQVDEATMLSGESRFNSRSFHPKTFPLSWDRLPIADILTLDTLANYNVRLHFQNAWIDATWRWVMVTEFEFTPVVYIGTMQFSATMTLREVRA